MGSRLEDSATIGILMSSLQVPKLAIVTASIKTIPQRNLKWQHVSARVIEEAANLRQASDSGFKANAVSIHCQICSRSSHSTERSFLNPLNPDNKLQLSNGAVQHILTPSKRKEYRVKSHTPGKSKQSKSGGSAMAKIKSRQKNQKSDWRLMDSSTTSHMTPFSEKVRSTSPCDVTINLADDSSANAQVKGTRMVKWFGDGGSMNVHLSETLVVPDMALSLLSVPALTTTKISVLFMPGKAFLVDLENSFSILGTAVQDDDGVYYIPDSELAACARMSRTEKRSQPP